MRLLYVHEPKNDLALIDFFLKEADGVHEQDYGDCMREWNRELLYLRDHLDHRSDWILNKITEMQNYIQFTPNWDVDSTKNQILEDGKKLREYLILSQQPVVEPVAQH